MAKSGKKEKDQRDMMLDQIDFHGLSQEEVLGQGGLIKQLTGRILWEALECEMDLYLGYEKHEPAGNHSGDSRNGHTGKTVFTKKQETVIPVPRDQKGTFQPQIILEYQKRVSLFNDQIISMYAFGMMERDIKAQLEKIYNVEVSPDLIGRVSEGGYGGSTGEAKPSVRKILWDYVALETIGGRGKEEGKTKGH
jgi:hypothetical protein